MQALKIDAQNKKVETLDIAMSANTVYSFFSSILIDELPSLREHVIYTDVNALSEQKEPYFVGEQLLLGDALILGREDFNDTDVKIKAEELESLIIKEVNAFYKRALSTLAQSDANLYRTFTLESRGENIELNAEWVLYTFNIADERTQEYFLTELEKVVKSDENVMKFLEKMAGLALKASQN